jgi:transglutaminase-like putative cysteine protease
MRSVSPPTRYLDNVYFQDGLLVTAILGGLLFVILAISMDAAGHVSTGMSVVVPVTIGAVILATLMSFSRFDNFFALSHAFFTGLALVLFLMAGNATQTEIAPILDKGVPELQARTYFVLLRLLNWLDAAINRTASADNYVFIFEISLLLWWLAFLGMWSILRYGYIWRAVTPAAMVLVLNAYYAPQSVLGLLALFSLLALLLLTRTNLSEQQLRWRDQRVYVSQEIGWDFVRTGLTYSVIVLTIAWLAPGLGRSAQVRQLFAPINEQWEETSLDLNRLYQGLNRRAEPGSAAFGRSLSLGGERNVGDSLVFNVKTAAGRYWRAVVYDTYDGRGWLNTGETEIAFDAFQPVPIPAWDARAPVTQTITLMAPTGNVVFGAPDIRQMDLPIDVLAVDVPAPALEAPPLEDETLSTVEFSMVRARETLDIGDAYTLLSSATTVTELALENAGEEYPASIVDRFVQIPADFSPQVIALAQTLTVSATTSFAKAKAIESYLRTIPYNDAISAPPPDMDPLEYFLFDIREGYCDYYATAMAMMLRTLGVPARTASGYAEGVYDEESGLYYVTERDAHTWVEVFFPGLGWVEFEPTAAESPLNRPRGDEGASATIAEQQTQDQSPQAGPTGSPSDLNQPLSQFPEEGDSFAADALADDPFWWLWVWLTPILLIVGLALLWRFRLAGPSAFTPDLPVILFDRLQRWAIRIGLSAQPTQTPYEQAHQWQQALPEGQQPISQITDSYVNFRFARPVATARDERQPVGVEVSAWRKLEPVLWKAWLRKLLPKPKNKINPYELG